jgi:hypothetical protein
VNDYLARKDGNLQRVTNDGVNLKLGVIDPAFQLGQKLDTIIGQLEIITQYMETMTGDGDDLDYVDEAVPPRTKYNGVLPDGWRCTHRHRTERAAEYCAGREARRRRIETLRRKRQQERAVEDAEMQMRSNEVQTREQRVRAAEMQMRLKEEQIRKQQEEAERRRNGL